MRKFIVLCLLMLVHTASAQESAWIPKIERYLNNIQSVSATFEQQQYGFQTLDGKLLLEKPGKLRLSYNPPQDILLVTNDGRAVFYDKGLDEISHFFTDSLPFHFLLKRNITLNNDKDFDVKVEEQIKQIALTLSSKTDEHAPITFYFSKRPFKLQNWTYPAPDGSQVTIQIQNLKTNLPIADHNFVFKTPKRKRSNK